MQAWDAIRWVDEKMHNVYSQEDKLGWLSQVEGMARALADRYGAAGEEAPLCPDSQLTIQSPYDQLYLRWLEAQINYAGQEYLKYNNAMTIFNALWVEYANWFVRNHMAEGKHFKC